MRKVPFTISFVTTFTDSKEVEKVAEKDLAEVCRQGLLDLLELRFMPDINKGAKTITVEVVK